MVCFFFETASLDITLLTAFAANFSFFHLWPASKFSPLHYLLGCMTAIWVFGNWLTLISIVVSCCHMITTSDLPVAFLQAKSMGNLARKLASHSSKSPPFGNSHLWAWKCFWHTTANTGTSRHSTVVIYLPASLATFNDLGCWKLAGSCKEALA